MKRIAVFALLVDLECSWSIPASSRYRCCRICAPVPKANKRAAKEFESTEKIREGAAEGVKKANRSHYLSDPASARFLD